MSTLLTVMGGIFITLILIALAFIVYSNISEYLDKKKAERERRAHIKAAKEIGYKLIDASYWYSADPQIYNTLKLIGTSLSNYQSFNPDAIRSEVKAAGNKKLN